MKEGIREMEVSVSLEDIENIFHVLDINGDDKISLDEFEWKLNKYMNKVEHKDAEKVTILYNPPQQEPQNFRGFGYVEVDLKLFKLSKAPQADCYSIEMAFDSGPAGSNWFVLSPHEDYHYSNIGDKRLVPISSLRSAKVMHLYLIGHQ